MSAPASWVEGRRSSVCSVLLARWYGACRSSGLRSGLRRMIMRLEGGAMYSVTVRDLYRRYHDLDVGLYTIGPCEAGPASLAPGTSIGRYCSIYYTVRTMTRDPLAAADQKPILAFGSVWDQPETGQEHRSNLAIGNDVFIGHNAIILPSAERIGDGAFIGAGSVVRSPVPPYAIVMGNPARVIKYRFSSDRIQELLESRWWLKTASQLRNEIGDFQKPLEGDVVR